MKYTDNDNDLITGVTSSLVYANRYYYAKDPLWCSDRITRGGSSIYQETDLHPYT